MSEKFNSAKLIMISNLSGTMHWDGSASKSPSMTIGISKQQTVAKTYSFSMTSELGFQVPIKSLEISAKLGGSYTSAKTYERAIGTSAVYTLDKSSDAGYYAIIAAVNADVFDVTLTQNGNTCSRGKMLKYESTNTYKKLYYSPKSY
ncbi:MAG: hypothetical protein K2J91_03490 [Lachnospiraceae bacterium]|nr:hypothetical protein [Lachnospiraceae bacterium]